MKKILFLLFIVLTIPAFAQDLVVLNNGRSMNVFKLDLSSSDNVYYQLSDADTAQVHRITRSEILIIKKADGTKVDPNTPTTKQEEVAVEVKQPDLDLTNYHGFLMSKGNSVYVVTNSTIDYERAGQDHLKEAIKGIGFWQVVDTPEQAHFVLQYWVDLKGADRGLIYARTTDSYKQNPRCSYNYSSMFEKAGPGSVVWGIGYCSEEKSDNIMAVDKILDFYWHKKKTGYATQYLDITKSNRYKEYQKKGLVKP